MRRSIARTPTVNQPGAGSAQAASHRSVGGVLWVSRFQTTTELPNEGRN